MNRRLPLAILSLALMAGAQEAQDFSLEESLSVRVPGNAKMDSLLGEVLGTKSVREALRDALCEALPADQKPTRCFEPTPTIAVIEPMSHAIVRLLFVGKATVAPVRSAATAEAIAQVLRRRLDVLLVEPAMADCERQLAELDQRIVSCNRELAEAEQRAAEFGSDGAGTLDAAIAELTQRLLSLQVEERTEQDVGQSLRDRLLDAQKTVAEPEEKLRALEATLSMTENQLAGASDQNAVASLRMLISGLRPQLTAAHAELDRANQLVAALQQQVIGSAENARRLTTTRQHLEAQLAKCRVDNADARDGRFRQATQKRRIAFCEQELAALHQELVAVQRRRLALRPVEVRSWQ